MGVGEHPFRCTVPGRKRSVIMGLVGFATSAVFLPGALFVAPSGWTAALIPRIFLIGVALQEVFRRHAVELHDLSEVEGAAFMPDIRRLSAAVQGVTGAHFLPRYPDDAFEGGPIRPKTDSQPAHAPGDFAAFRVRLLGALMDASVDRRERAHGES